ncbi:MAG TPA: hypothetical protein VES19_11400 [Candidatus Limnocylindrales bacterium]|nr:hypothetical protein [Candidatus Limnocylindrales bacterium]
MTSRRNALDTRHQNTLLNKETHMQHIELRLADIAERQALLRSIREGDRAASGRAWSIRRSVGESLVRLGRRIGGDTVSAPAWQG